MPSIMQLFLFLRRNLERDFADVADPREAHADFLARGS